ncbi:helix-turn-helix transcriptional regulator [Mesorhizobium sp. M0663]
MNEGWRDRIVRRLAERDLTMKEASLLAGKGETFVRDILKRGRTPSTANLEALSRVLRVSVADLLDGGQQPATAAVDKNGAPNDGANIRAELAEVFSDLVKADEEVQRVALKMLRRTVYGAARSRPIRTNGSS